MNRPTEQQIIDALGNLYGRFIENRGNFPLPQNADYGAALEASDVLDRCTRFPPPPPSDAGNEMEICEILVDASSMSPEQFTEKYRNFQNWGEALAYITEKAQAALRKHEKLCDRNREDKRTPLHHARRRDPRLA